MTKTILAVAGCAAVSTLLFSQESPAPSVPVPVTVTAAAPQGKSVPVLHPEDFLAYQRHERFQIVDVVPLQGDRASLDLFFLLDDASSSSLATQFGDLREFIDAQPPTTAIGIGYMRNGTVDTVQRL